LIVYGESVHVDAARIQSVRHNGLRRLMESDNGAFRCRAHPGNFIRVEILNELGLSVSHAPEVLGVRRATLSDLVNGRATLSAEMALRIEKAFGVSMDMLLRMQAWYDGYVMRQREREIAVKRYSPAA
jgi:antitoxin HigA-1